MLRRRGRELRAGADLLVFGHPAEQRLRRAVHANSTPRRDSRFLYCTGLVFLDNFFFLKLKDRYDGPLPFETVISPMNQNVLFNHRLSCSVSSTDGGFQPRRVHSTLGKDTIPEKLISRNFQMVLYLTLILCSHSLTRLVSTKFSCREGKDLRKIRTFLFTKLTK